MLPAESGLTSPYDTPGITSCAAASLPPMLFGASLPDGVGIASTDAFRRLASNQKASLPAKQPSHITSEGRKSLSSVMTLSISSISAILNGAITSNLLLSTRRIFVLELSSIFLFILAEKGLNSNVPIFFLSEAHEKKNLFA
jgi:hypothetical protein